MANKARKKTAKAKKSPVKHRKSPRKVAKKPQGSGKFVKGQATVGRTKTGKHPEFKQKLDFALAFKEAVTRDDIKEIAEKLVTKAK